MRRSEALAALELSERATPAEIKAAYRDLVKVWHPDRFGSDARLRQRAEERLQRMNEAFHRLESGDLEPESYVPPEFVATAPARAASAGPQVGRDAVLRGWVYLAIFMIAGAYAGYAVVQHERAVREAADIAATSVAGQPATATPPGNTSGAAGSAGVRRIGHPAVQISRLSDAQTEQIEAACGQFEPGTQERGDCVRQKVAALTGSVDLGALNAEEQTSVEHVCARAVSYSQCAAEQIAGLSDVPLRPDVSRLTGRERSAVERACSSARDHDGPAAYDRCVVEFEKALASRER